MKTANKTLFLILCLGFFGWAGESQSVCSLELFKDPGLQQGFALSSANTRPREQWCAMPLGPNPVWEVAELASTTYFCDNLPQPKSLNPAVFLSPNSDKEFIINSSGGFRLKFDSSHEEQNGCFITNPRQPTQSQVTYGFTQQFDPAIDFLNYDSLAFRMNTKLNKAQQLNGCDNVSAEARLGLVFLLDRKDGTVGEPNYIWIMGVPCNTDNLNTLGCDFWPEGEGVDNLGAYIYHPKPARFPLLQQGQWVNYFFNLKLVAQDAINFYNLSHPAISLNDFTLKHFIVHWEIWGGYDTDVEFENLSLIGNMPGACPADTIAPAAPSNLSLI